MSENDPTRNVDVAAQGEAPAQAQASPGTAAAEAAIALVQQTSARVNVAKPARRLRVFALSTITLAVFAFAACIFTGSMLSLWAGEEIVTPGPRTPLSDGQAIDTSMQRSPQVVVYVEENHGAVVASHVAAGVIAIVALIGYALLHVRFRRLLKQLDLDEKTRKRVFSGWVVMPISVMIAATLITAAIIGNALPEKPRTIDILEERLEGSEVDEQFLGGEFTRRELGPQPPPTEGQPSPIPPHVRGTQDEEAWMLHTFWLPLFIGLALMVLLPAVYTLQRSRDALRSLDEPGEAKEPKRGKKKA